MTLTMPNQQMDSLLPVKDDVVLSVQGVSKKFCRDLKRSLMYGVSDISQEMLGLRGENNTTLRKKEFWALQDVSFELRRGEALGLVGKNGSGKSTLLRILAGLIKPDVGKVEIRGRLAPLIALGAGFNPILTGRENIYANMSILGLSKEEIDGRFEEVIEFSEIGDAIDSPVQNYSSGMAARLGFASAVFTMPDILLIDEVLAVGDSRFQEKCRRKLYELRQSGVTFILVSHYAPHIRETCPVSVYLSQGKQKFFGDTAVALKCYEEELHLLKGNTNTSKEKINQNRFDIEETGLQITQILFRDANLNKVDKPIAGKLTHLSIKLKSIKNLTGVGLIVCINSLDQGGQILGLSSFDDDCTFDIAEGEYEINMKMPYLGLKLGLYSMDIYIKKDSVFTLDFMNSVTFTVLSEESMGVSQYYQPRNWEIHLSSAIASTN